MAQCEKKGERQLVALLKPENLYQSFGLIFLLLASIGVISFTSKFIFGLGRVKIIKSSDQIYDPDHGRNFTQICPLTTNAYRIRSNRTVCFNKTMHYWYIPWMHYSIWRNFDEINNEKRFKHLREQERAKHPEIEENNETKAENVVEEVTDGADTPSNRKVKDEPSKVVCTILAALLVISSAVAFCEVFRDKCMTKTKTSPRQSKQSFTYRNPSLNELVKQSPEVQRQEPFQSTAKKMHFDIIVTKFLLKASGEQRLVTNCSSLGYLALSACMIYTAVCSVLATAANLLRVKPLFRRSSVPAQMMSSIGPNDPTTFLQGYPPGSAGFGQQMILSDSPETRRKSRHFIRRH